MIGGGRSEPPWFFANRPRVQSCAAKGRFGQKEKYSTCTCTQYTVLHNDNEQLYRRFMYLLYCTFYRCFSVYSFYSLQNEFAVTRQPC